MRDRVGEGQAQLEDGRKDSEQHWRGRERQPRSGGTIEYEALRPSCPRATSCMVFRSSDLEFMARSMGLG